MAGAPHSADGVPCRDNPSSAVWRRDKCTVAGGLRNARRPAGGGVCEFAAGGKRVEAIICCCTEKYTSYIPRRLRVRFEICAGDDGGACCGRALARATDKWSAQSHQFSSWIRRSDARWPAPLALPDSELFC
jgi:hypothetical protein